jgi:glycolate oxidase iron-sulfur subunit
MMNTTDYNNLLSKCVRCGACKTLCPTYLTTLNEAMGARGRVAILGELSEERLTPTRKLAEKIYSCMLCGACKGICPTGINIPEMIYEGRSILKNSFNKGRILRKVLRSCMSKPDMAFSVLRIMQKLFYQPVQKVGGFRYIPDITSKPFKNSVQVYKNIKKIGRVAIFAGCNVNYFYPSLGDTLSNILLSKGYEIVVFKGELCCGTPLRSVGLEKESVILAEKNIEHFSKVRAEAVISMCPTCTMVIKEQYPVLTGSTILNIIDINEFILKNDIFGDLEIEPRVMTYHDPCHLSHGLGIRNEPRQILRGINGIDLVEMQHADECCGFAGLFSLHFKKISKEISHRKFENIRDTSADTVVTSCPGCIMQIEATRREYNSKVKVMHVVEVIAEAMHDQNQKKITKEYNK